VITIARLTVGEAARRRVLWVLLILAAVAVGLTGWGVDRLVASARADGVNEIEIRLAVSQVLIFIAFNFGFVLAMTAAFLGSPAIANDLESGVALALLARPLRRSSFLMGRWLGLAAVIVAYAVGSGLVAILVVSAISGFEPPNPLVPVAYLAGQALMLLSLTMLLSVRLPPIGGGAIAVVAFGLAWLAGVMGGVGKALHADVLTSVASVARILLPTDGLWRGVIFGLEPPVVIAAMSGQQLASGNPFFEAAPPPLAFVAWSVAWVILVMALAALLLRRREL
jgi:ABC-type transport system involved in multi-copper enzyme maturation permease subunit